MCFAPGCGRWPWGHPEPQLAAEPIDKRYIYLDENVEFYPDPRTPSSQRDQYTHFSDKMPNFYTYQNPYPSQLATSSQGQAHWENPADWPKTYIYVTNQDGLQGIHPPGPVYTANPPAQSNMFYYPGGAGTPGGYVVNGVFYPTAQPAAATPATGWPSYTCYPLPAAPASTTPSACTAWPFAYSPYCAAPQPFQVPTGTPWTSSAAAAQVAAVIAANTALAATPNAPSFFVGTSAAEIQAQNAILQANLYNLAASQAQAQAQPTQIAPYKPGTGQQFWCKEADGSWTLRDQTDAATLGAGHWETHSTSGYHYFVKHAS
ncbi:hypothetical protein LTR84_010880 [Exophiala bonariae]|uniref:Uncharacterized protein n=1 Tax=Exophiala bonariae TaxID=1690606 RepID=A0AAV9NIQ6_9EURO|nr:hypothetical protein LTR84_010880 [Exophiala bonariae]